MTNLEKIKHAIITLPRDDIFALARWFAKFHAELWGNQAEDFTDRWPAGRPQPLASSKDGKPGIEVFRDKTR